MKNHIQLEKTLLYTKYTEMQNLPVILLGYLPLQTTANTDMPTDKDEVRRGLRMGGEMHVGEEEKTSSTVSLWLPQSSLWDRTLYLRIGNQNSTMKFKEKL